MKSASYSKDNFLKEKCSYCGGEVGVRQEITPLTNIIDDMYAITAGQSPRYYGCIELKGTFVFAKGISHNKQLADGTVKIMCSKCQSKKDKGL